MNRLRKIRGAVLLLPLLGGLVSLSAQDYLSPKTRPIVLFNGKHFDDFYSWLVDTKYNDPRRVFTVTNQLLRISGDGLGYLATRAPYGNYRLVAEWKWGTQNWPWGNRVGAARDSGIFLHSLGPDGSSHDGCGAFRAAIECQLFQGATGDLLLIRGTNENGAPLSLALRAEVASARDADGWPYWQKGGMETNLNVWGRLNWFGKDTNWRDVTDFRGPRDPEKPPGEWNRIECVCEENRISVILNGTLINQASNVYPPKGKILLQCEGSEIFFRRLELLPLKP